MNKDAYYFPHFSNARHDRKLKRVRKELGVEGYGIYFMILETLRDQEQFKFPLDDIDLLADEFGTSEQKVRTVICNYQLFQVDENQNFFSLRFVEYLQPYLDSKHRNRVNGIKGNLIRYGYITKEDADSMNDAEILELNEHRQTLMLLPSAGESGGEQPSDRKESKVKENKVKENKTLWGLCDEMSDELKQAYIDFNTMRNSIKKKMTERALKTIINKIDGFTSIESEKIAILEQSIEHSWQTVYELKNSKQTQDRTNRIGIPQAEPAGKRRPEWE